jgi:arsenate reductase (thioredoxin)
MDTRRILFVCIGNAFRSQMAEGFLRKYGSHAWEVHSAGLAPVSSLPRETVLVMAEKGIDVSRQYPKELSSVRGTRFDIVVNMSGIPLPGISGVTEWGVQDPVGASTDTLRRVRDEIEDRVQRLLLTERVLQRTSPAPPAERPLIRRRPKRNWDPEGWRRVRDRSANDQAARERDTK